MMESDEFLIGDIRNDREGTPNPIFHSLLSLLLLLSSLSLVPLYSLFFLSHPLWISLLFFLSFLIVFWKRMYERTS